MPEKFDALIIGGGPAGISAALTLRHRSKSVALISNPPDTTNLWKAKDVGNYPGIDGAGPAIESAMLKQLADSGTETIDGRALSVVPLGKSFGVAVGGDFYEGRTVIMTVGITRESAYPGENEFLGRGVSYCATCDGMLYKGRTVAVVGSGKEVENDVKFLASIGCEVLRFDGFGKAEIRGGDKAHTLIYNGEEYKVDCVFILKDTISVTKLVPGLEYKDGGVVVDKQMATNIPGVFAAGDCTGRPYQIAKSVGEGNLAALSASEYLEELN
ncbi:MAG TPA: FAD-dependent oxidoreductase [Oscillospiraceae bacterium]|nr:FAD-dependent oxidoreductase [Oscillospiraceae bacterium]